MCYGCEVIIVSRVMWRECMLSHTHTHTHTHSNSPGYLWHWRGEDVWIIQRIHKTQQFDVL